MILKAGKMNCIKNKKLQFEVFYFLAWDKAF